MDLIKFTIIPCNTNVPPGPGAFQHNPTKYRINDQSGNVLYWVLNEVISGGIAQGTGIGKSLVVKDANQHEALRVNGSQVFDGLGKVIGTISAFAKPIKEHKKDKAGKDDGKRQVILEDPMKQVLLSMTGKNKGVADGHLDYKIKTTKKLDKVKDLKDKIPKLKEKSKDKEKKDKDFKKAKEIGNVTGSFQNGLSISLPHGNLPMQDKLNAIALLIGFMESELEKHGQMKPTPTTAYPTNISAPQGYPGNPSFPPGQGYVYPHNQPFPINVAQPYGTNAPMGFVGGSQIQPPPPGVPQFPHHHN